MKTLTTALLTSFMAFAAVSATAQDAVRKDNTMVDLHMTMQQCKDHMERAGRGSRQGDDAMRQKDAYCSDMMKKHGVKMSGMVDRKMTLQECKDRMAMANRGSPQGGDGAMKRKDTQCSDMIKKDGMMK